MTAWRDMTPEQKQHKNAGKTARRRARGVLPTTRRVNLTLEDITQQEEINRQKTRDWKRAKRAAGWAGSPGDIERRFQAAERAAWTEAVQKVKRIERLEHQLARIEREAVTLCIQCGVNPRYGPRRLCWPCVRQRVRDKRGHMQGPINYPTAAATGLFCTLASKPDPEVRKAKREQRNNFMRKSYYEQIGVTVVQLPMDGPCGVCKRPIDPNEKHGALGEHNPKARSLGHEPPKSTLRRGDTLYLRPEHWLCNWIKSDMTDEELGLTG